jgi:hypothetical protein
LSYANEHRPGALFEELFWTALARFRQQQGLGSRKHKFRFKNKLFSLDSTTISLCLTMFPWAQFRRAKGGVKAHVLLDHGFRFQKNVLTHHFGDRLRCCRLWGAFAVGRWLYGAALQPQLCRMLRKPISAPRCFGSAATSRSVAALAWNSRP